jgi:hypothetical protein
VIPESFDGEVMFATTDKGRIRVVLFPTEPAVRNGATVQSVSGLISASIDTHREMLAKLK